MTEVAEVEIDQATARALAELVCRHLAILGPDIYEVADIIARGFGVAGDDEMVVAVYRDDKGRLTVIGGPLLLHLHTSDSSRFEQYGSLVELYGAPNGDQLVMTEGAAIYSVSEPSIELYTFGVRPRVAQMASDFLAGTAFERQKQS